MPVKLPRYDDDLFKESTMTFGEHLEELRRCLFMALLGLVVGFLLGLVVGRQVVALFERPLSRALTDFYQRDAHERAAAANLPYSSQDLDKLIDQQGLIFDEVEVDPRQLAEGLSGRPPGTAAPASGEISPPPKLVPLRIWRRVKDDGRVRAKAFAFSEGFMIYVKAALISGAVMSSPWVFFWLWTFVAAGLYPHEKHYVYIFLPFSLGLFLLGASVAFFFVFDPVLSFLLSYNRWLGIDPEPRISEWLNFVLVLPLGFGISFQLPLVMLFLERIGLFTVRLYMERWRIAVLAIFVISMILTPADPYSMILMAGPLTFLYFSGVLLCRWMPRGPGLLPPLE